MKIAIVGASGYVGAHLVPHLAAQGHAVRAAARRLDALAAREWQGVEIVAAESPALRNQLGGDALVHQSSRIPLRDAGAESCAEAVECAETCCCRGAGIGL